MIGINKQVLDVSDMPWYKKVGRLFLYSMAVGHGMLLIVYLYRMFILLYDATILAAEKSYFYGLEVMALTSFITGFSTILFVLILSILWRLLPFTFDGKQSEEGKL